MPLAGQGGWGGGGGLLKGVVRGWDDLVTWCGGIMVASEDYLSNHIAIPVLKKLSKTKNQKIRKDHNDDASWHLCGIQSLDLFSKVGVCLFYHPPPAVEDGQPAATRIS